MTAENTPKAAERPTHVLLIEDDSGYARLVQEMLRRENDIPLTIYHSLTLMDGFKILAKVEIDVILLDLTLPDSSGIDTFLGIKGVVPEIPVVVLTAIDDEELAVSSVKQGAQDYLYKAEVRPRLLVRTLRYAVERKLAAQELRKAYEQLEVKVRERTSELAHLNDILKMEIEERKHFEQQLQMNEELYRATIESAADGIFVVNENGEVTHVNARFSNLLGVPEDLLVEKNDEKLLNYFIDKLENPDDFLSRGDGLYQTSKDSIDVLTFKDGRVFERHTRPLIRNKQYAGRVWNFKEITDRKHAEEDFKRIERSFNTISDKSQDIICEIGRDGIVTYISYATEKILGIKPREIVGSPFLNYVSESNKTVMEKNLEKALSGEYIEGLQIDFMKAKGAPASVEINLSPVFLNKEITGVLGIARDITKRTKMNEKLWLSLMTDPLTGLYNQRQFSKMIEDEVKRAKRIPYPLSLALFELNGAKAQDGAHENLTHDEVLVEIGKIIKRLIRKDTDIAFRHGDDEFAILLPNATKKDALSISSRLIDKIKRRMGYAGVKTGFSFLEDTMSPEDFIDTAVEAMKKQDDVLKQKVFLQKTAKRMEAMS